MSWSTPVVPVTATLITSAWGTVIVEDLIAQRGSPANICVAYKQAQQNVTDGNTAALTLTSEETDTATMHDNSTNPARITVPSGGAGRYNVRGQAYIQSTGGVYQLLLQKNGSTIRVDLSQSLTPQVAAFGISMVATDYFQLAGKSAGGDTVFGDTSGIETRIFLEVEGPLPPA